jgi:hypothetical protein
MPFGAVFARDVDVAGADGFAFPAAALRERVVSMGDREPRPHMSGAAAWRENALSARAPACG